MLLWISQFWRCNRSDTFLSSNVMDGISLVELQKYQKGKKKNGNNNKLTTWDAAMSLSKKL